MGGASGERSKRSLPTLPYYLAAILVTSSSGLHGKRAAGDVLQIFSGGEDALESIASPVTSAGDRAAAALDGDDLFDPADRPRELPVWPPPVHTAPVDPAANPMIGAPPQRVDWPAGVPSSQPKPAHSATPPKP